MNKEDKILSIIREKLESHKVPFNTEEGWKEMESRLLASDSKKKRTHRWLHYSSVAAAVMLFSLVLTNNKDEASLPKEITITSIPTTIKEQVGVISNLENTEIEGAIKETPKSKNKYILSSDVNKKYTNEDIEVKEPIIEVVAEKLIGEKTKDAKLEIPKVDDNYIHRLLDKDLPANTNTVEKQNTKGNWQIAAGLKSAGASENNGSEALPDAYSLAMPTKSTYKKVDTENKVNHNVPLSFGIKVKKKFNDKWAIQTGITYTYLRSTFKSGYDGLNTVSYTQDLHYLGIPLSVSYSIISKPKWEMYASVGAAIDKGLANVKKEENKRKTSNISGVQMSMNGAIGAQYNISKSLNLFLEPNVAYYFDNKQPSSARTRASLTFELNAGLGITL